MSDMSDNGPPTARELAVEFTDLWKTFDTAQINSMLARNVSFELLEFFSVYAREFAEDCDGAEELLRRMPNLLVIGYLIRILEERVD